MRKWFLLMVLYALVMLSAGDTRAAVVQPNVALWAPVIEYSPGEVMLLRPRFPAVDTTNGKHYELRLELPAALKQKELNLADLDQQGGFLLRPRTRRHEVKGNTQTFIYQPELEQYPGMKVIPGATYTFSCQAKGEGIAGSGFQLSGYFRDAHKTAIDSYPAYITFDQGAYDWKRFEVQLHAPKNAKYLILIILKWPHQASYGTLYVDDLSLTCDKQPGENLILAGDMEKAKGIKAWPLTNSLVPVVAPKPHEPHNLALRVSGTKRRSVTRAAIGCPCRIPRNPSTWTGLSCCPPWPWTCPAISPAATRFIGP